MSRVNQDRRTQSTSSPEGELPSPHRAAAAIEIISGAALSARHRYSSDPEVKDSVAAIKARRISPE